MAIDGRDLNLVMGPKDIVIYNKNSGATFIPTFAVVDDKFEFVKETY